VPVKRSTPVAGMSGTPWLLDQHAVDAVLPKPYYNKDLFDLISHFTLKKQYKISFKKIPLEYFFTIIICPDTELLIRLLIV